MTWEAGEGQRLEKLCRGREAARPGHIPPLQLSKGSRQPEGTKRGQSTLLPGMHSVFPAWDLTLRPQSDRQRFMGRGRRGLSSQHKSLVLPEALSVLCSSSYGDRIARARSTLPNHHISAGLFVGP